ncbi:MAG: hypothetical protein JXP34_28975, partial [Planctomycetes bacterium]|nr:hypothetical protein [Planctomycetota bacterium]
MSPFARTIEDPRENPVVYRTIASGFTGRRVAFLLGFFHIVIGGLLIAFLGMAMGVFHWRMLEYAIGWGPYTHAILQTGIFGLLVLLLPLRLSRLIDGPRRDGCFAEVVAAGISPHRIAAGGAIVGAGYAGFLIATTIPYAVFCYLLGDLAVGDVLLAYAAQAGFALVVIVAAVAAAILSGARAAAGVSILLGGLGLLGVLEVPAAAAWFTPVRFFLGPILTSTAGNEFMEERVKALFGPPTLCLNEIPAWIYGPGLWILVAVAGLCLILAGPAHDFRPGFARRARPVEVAFLYRNLPARSAGKAFFLRAFALSAIFVAIACAGVGLAYEPQLVERVKTQRIALRALGWIVAPLGILDIIAIQGAGLRRRIEGIGPIRASRGAWWDLFFILSLALCFLLAVGPALLGLESTGGPRAQVARNMEDLLPSLAWGFAALGLFLAELHLLARALSHIFVLPSRARIICAITAAVALLAPLVVLEPLYSSAVLGDWARDAMGLFPGPAVTRAVTLGELDYKVLPLLIAVHGSLLGLLGVANLILGHRARRRLAGAIGLSILLCLAAPSIQAAEGDIDLQVIPGIGGYASAWTVPIGVEISNRGDEPVCGDLRILEPEGKPCTVAEGIEVFPGTTVRRRILALASWGAHRSLRIEFGGDGIRVVRSITPSDVVRVQGSVIHIDRRGRGLALPGPKGELSLSVARSRPEYLPDASLAYDWAVLVVLGDADPNEWDPAQVGALEGYVRSGGTLAISGGRRPGAFYATQVIARWVGDAAPAREGQPLVREIPFGLGRIVLSGI